jgi:alpha-L-arabinofuranosidase
MHRAGIFGLVILLLAAMNILYAQEHAAVTIEKQFVHDRPISPYIYGGFLEHMAKQMEATWAELLQDVSFEGYTEYARESHGWAEGPIDESAVWWHSGYEQREWQAVGAEGDNTVENKELSGMFHGSRARRIINKGDGPCGIAQGGVPLKAGMTYRFKGYFSTGVRWGRREGEPAREISIGLYGGKDLSIVYDEVTVPLQDGYLEHEAMLTATETTNDATFAILLKAPGRVDIDLVSLMPQDNIDGWRPDVVAALRDIGMTSYRYPGGCFTSFVDWETMVGPRERRPHFRNPFWGELEPNYVGTDEFLRLMELVDGEPMLCANIISGTAERAADWVEYCNGNLRSRYGALRAKNGRPEPWNVTYWELGNEVLRKYTAREYADISVAYAKAMRVVDPTIKIMVGGYFWPDEDLRLILEKAGPYIDYIAVRTVDKDALRVITNLAREYSTPAHPLYVASTEWRNKWRKDAWIPFRHEGSQRRVNMSWGYALECARTFHAFQREGDVLTMGHYGCVANMYGENALEVAKDAVAVSAVGHAFALMSDIQGRVLKTQIGADIDKLDVNTLLDESADLLTCTLIHGGDKPATVALDLSGLTGLPSKATVTSLSASDNLTMAGFKDADAIKKIETAPGIQTGKITVSLPSYSITKVQIRLVR